MNSTSSVLTVTMFYCTVDVYIVYLYMCIYMKLTFFLTGERPSVTAVPSDWNNVRQCLMSRVGGVSKNKNDYVNQLRKTD